MVDRRSAIDVGLAQAARVIQRARGGEVACPQVHGFFHEPTSTASYLVVDVRTRVAAIIDSVLDYDAASGRTSHASADAIVDRVRADDLQIQWILETHVHADHLTASAYLQQRLGGRLGIGSHIVQVQRTFGGQFNLDGRFARDGSQFDRLFDDADSFAIGSLPVAVMHLPGHTPADLAYVIGDAIFAGDTVFMPDYGTARADFPGGDARRLFRSIRRLLALPREARLFLCHDYKAPGRDEHCWETTIGAQRDANVHVRDGIDEDSFVAMRTARDRSLSVPALILPSIQVNMRAGHLPEPEDNGLRYLKAPLDAF